MPSPLPDRPLRLSRRELVAAALGALCVPRAWAEADDQPVLLVLTSDALDRSVQVASAFTRTCDFATRWSYQIPSLDTTGAFILENLPGRAPSLIFSIGALAAQVALREFPDTPVVYSEVREGDVAPGTNALSLSLRVGPETTLRRLRGVFPQISRVGCIVREGPDDYGDRIAAGAAAAGFTITQARVARPGEAAAAFTRLRACTDLVWLHDDPVLWRGDTLTPLLDEAHERRFPILGFHRIQLDGPKPASLVACAAASDVGEAGANVARALLLGDPMPAADGAPPVLIGHARAMRAAGLAASAALDEIVG